MVFNDLLVEDSLKAMVSIVFVYLYMNFHLRSCLLSLVGISIIILSFPITVIINSYIFQVKYFGALQICIIYIVLGIGCDDIFVLYDAWMQSATIDKDIINTKQKRMAYTFRRAVRAMALTSSTTAIAFFGNIICPIMPMRAFSIFAGTIVPINFVLVVVMMPPILIWYENNI